MTKRSLDLTKAETLTQILPNSPQITSQQAQWSSLILADYHQHPGCESPLASFQQPVLEIITNNSGSNHERRMGRTHLSYPLRSGEICFCPADTNHWTVWEQPLSFTIVAFDSCFLNQLSQQLFKQSCIEFTPQWQVFDPVIQTIVTALKTDLEAGCPAGSLYGESFGTSLAVHLLRQFTTREPQILKTKGLPRSTRSQILEFIEANLATDISLEALANFTNFSTFHFCRLFKDTMGVTPHQYVIRRRIERAKKLLKYSDLKIVEIALACGFANQSHLSRHFRNLVGISPKAYRNS
ncbi:MAG: helix-turn-helix domain-containing protein [Cyanobacteria bacterium]|jgi:AraC family transcriptional regulator|nr:helix-turn-helix domain-containing protein [Cyanobacteria bacterium GSL.Bin21]